MTKKHYKLIADVMYATKPVYGSSDDEWNEWETICEEFARELKRTNLHFRPYTFLGACGYGKR